MEVGPFRQNFCLASMNIQTWGGDKNKENHFPGKFWMVSSAESWAEPTRGSWCLCAAPDWLSECGELELPERFARDEKNSQQPYKGCEGPAGSLPGKDGCVSSPGKPPVSACSHAVSSRGRASVRRRGILRLCFLGTCKVPWPGEGRGDQTRWVCTFLPHFGWLIFLLQ